DPSKSYARRIGEEDLFDNRMIFGDNLLVLKALEADLQGQVKCVFIDPPYNTGSAFEHYDDGVEHSIWLSLIRDRLEIIRRLLREDGSLWITIDDNEMHYLKVTCDEIFGRSNFVANLVWQKKYAKQNDAKWFSTSHDHILVYAKDKNLWRPNLIERGDSQLKGYSNPDNDERGLWQSVVYTCAKTRAERPNLYYGIKHPRTGQLIFPSETRVWGYDEKRHAEHVSKGMIWWGINQEKDKPRLKSFLAKVGTGLVPDTLWLRDDSGDNQDAKREMLALNAEDVFPTPKPEKLLRKLLEIATEAGDIVLDSFAGSGTTGAVAHKMGRQWVMVELGEHCHTHILPRIKKVIDGDDAGGVTETVGWEGGGGFRYYRLASSLLERDRWGNWVIARSYNAAMLAEAMCKHMGFTYSPSQDPAEYWRHGYSSERDFIFVTTANVTHDQLRAISEDVGPERTLLVCCKAFNARSDAFENLTVKKIPQAVLSRCEWGRDDYSLRIAEAPPPPEDTPPPATPQAAPPKRGRRATAASTEPSLFTAMDAKGAGK
ncbi:MAG TPA: site-specific DNA-methyltransferase, partial [Rhodopila sp.]|nr:site-specific DNA-methyltransferase [Rhodopila sp.]